MDKSKHLRIFGLTAGFIMFMAVLLAGFTYVSGGKAKAYSAALGNVLSSSVSGNVLTLTIDNDDAVDDILEIEVCDTDVLRVDYRPDSVTPSDDTPVVDPDLSWDAMDAVIDTSSDPITLETEDMLIEIATTPCRITVKKADGTTLFYEPDSGGVFYDGVRFIREDSTNMYGIHSYDCFTTDGNILRNDNTNTATSGQQGNSGGPFMWSTAGYGLLVDSDGGYPYTNSENNKMEFYYGDEITEGRRYEKADVEYYIMLGEPKEIMKSYSKITGVSPMMSKWSLGFSNFEWDIDEEELTDMVETYRAKDIPIDSYAFDYDWKEYGENNYGEFAWNTDNFPSASTTALKEAMDELGIKMIGITKPRIVTELTDGTATVQGTYAEENDFFYPGHYAYTDYFLPVTVRSIDPYDLDVRSWWWNHSTDAFDKGIVGWWNDETDKVSTSSASYWFGNFTTLFLSEAMYEGQREYTSDQVRVWQTARNYYSGTQRYATSIWSGDVATQFYMGERVSWAAGLNEQKAALLSTINNGQPKWGMDGGGFNENSGSIENPSPELYTRWLQFGAFTPVFRVHGTEYQQRQPWYFGDTAEEVTKAVIQLRYSLIPYMYAYEREAYDTGLGLIRPLVFDYPADENVADDTDSWMFGDYLLVAPVTERGQSSKSIYLPEGEWIDYFRGTTYTGGTQVSYALNGDSWTDIPLFIKKGAIIPTQDVQDYVGEDAINKLNIDIFPDTDLTSFDYYDDDGETYDYESDAYFRQRISTSGANNVVNVTINGKEGTYDNDLEYYYLAIHNTAGTNVTLDGVTQSQYSDYTSLLNTSGAGWVTEADVYGDVTYVKVPAGSTDDISIIVTGGGTITADSQTYEAEFASLSGDTISTQASMATDHTGYSGTGFVAGLDNEEAKVTFYAKVTNTGDYDVTIGYSNGNSTAKSMSIYVNGQYVTQAEFPVTTDWNTWDDLVINLPLTAGNNIISIMYNTETGDTGGINVDYISVPLYPNQIQVEAEASSLAGTASINTDHYFYSGSGFVDGITSAGAAVTFEVVIPEDGTYDSVIRFCNGTGSTKTVNMYINGTYYSMLSLESASSNWNDWRDGSASLTLAEGTNTITLQYDLGSSGNINIDYIAVSLDAGDTRKMNLLDNGGFERGADDCNWTEWHPSGQSVAYGVDAGSGINPPESPKEGDKRAYFYLADSYQQSIHQGVSVDNGTYRVEAWVKTYNTTPTTYRAEISNYGGTVIYENLPTTSGWHKVIIDDIEVTNSYIDIGFYTVSDGGTTVLIDDVALYKEE